MLAPAPQAKSKLSVVIYQRTSRSPPAVLNRTLSFVVALSALVQLHCVYAWFSFA